jgi:hypothetical protein
MNKPKPMPLSAAERLLALCQKNELADFTFGDSEINWTLDDEIIADGYIGKFESSCVSFRKEALEKICLYDSAEFKSADAWKLKNFGKKGRFERNDDSGSAYA